LLELVPKQNKTTIY